MSETRRASRKRKRNTTKPPPALPPPPPVQWRPPAFSLDSWFAARGVPGFRRAGFRAWCAGEGIDGDRPLREWDEQFSRFQAAPT